MLGILVFVSIILFVGFVIGSAISIKPLATKEVAGTFCVLVGVVALLFIMLYCTYIDSSLLEIIGNFVASRFPVWAVDLVAGMMFMGAMAAFIFLSGLLSYGVVIVSCAIQLYCLRELIRHTP
ncbi:hypothetical protein IKG49_00480 [Candidatus Saccharibacteria bacterium]|nr:hypothetical protein [Candidatus Saccharibacteria bacterium]